MSKLKEFRAVGGHHWIVPADGNINQIDVWWHRPLDHRKSGGRVLEMLVTRQIDKEQPVVLKLTLGQVYDLIGVLNKAVLKP